MVWLPFGVSSVTSFPKKLRAQVITSAKYIRDPRTLLTERQRQTVVRREEIQLDHLEHMHECCLCGAKGRTYKRAIDDDDDDEEDEFLAMQREQHEEHKGRRKRRAEARAAAIAGGAAGGGGLTAGGLSATAGDGGGGTSATITEYLNANFDLEVVSSGSYNSESDRSNSAGGDNSGNTSGNPSARASRTGSFAVRQGNGSMRGLPTRSAQNLRAVDEDFSNISVEGSERGSSGGGGTGDSASDAASDEESSGSSSSTSSDDDYEEAYKREQEKKGLRGALNLGKAITKNIGQATLQIGKEGATELLGVVQTVGQTVGKGVATVTGMPVNIVKATTAAAAKDDKRAAQTATPPPGATAGNASAPTSRPPSPLQIVSRHGSFAASPGAASGFNNYHSPTRALSFSSIPPNTLSRNASFAGGAAARVSPAHSDSDRSARSARSARTNRSTRSAKSGGRHHRRDRRRSVTPPRAIVITPTNELTDRPPLQRQGTMAGGMRKMERKVTVATFGKDSRSGAAAGPKLAGDKPEDAKKHLNPLLKILVEGFGKGGGDEAGGDGKKKKKKKRRYLKCHDGGLRKIHETEIDLFSSLFHRRVRGYLCTVCSNALRQHVEGLKQEIEQIVGNSSHKVVRGNERKSATRILLDAFGSPTDIMRVGGGNGGGAAGEGPSSPGFRRVQTAFGAQLIPDADDDDADSDEAFGDTTASRPRKRDAHRGSRGGGDNERRFSHPDGELEEELDRRRAAVPKIELWPAVASKIRANVNCSICQHRRAAFFYEPSLSFFCSICCARDRDYRRRAVPVSNNARIPADIAVVMATLIRERSNQRYRPRDYYNALRMFEQPTTLFPLERDLFEGANLERWPACAAAPRRDPCVLRLSEASFEKPQTKHQLTRVHFALEIATAAPTLNIPAPLYSGGAGERLNARDSVRSMSRQLFNGRVVRPANDLFALVWAPQDVCDWIAAHAAGEDGGSAEQWEVPLTFAARPPEMPPPPPTPSNDGGDGGGSEDGEEGGIGSGVDAAAEHPDEADEDSGRRGEAAVEAGGDELVDHSEGEAPADNEDAAAPALCNSSLREGDEGLTETILLREDGDEVTMAAQ